MDLAPAIILALLTSFPRRLFDTGCFLLCMLVSELDSLPLSACIWDGKKKHQQGVWHDLHEDKSARTASPIC